jgi:Mrp family chromosome partitioning ATPase
VLKSPQAAIATARTVPGFTPQAVTSAIAVEPRGGSDVVTITATEHNAAAAARLANAYTTQALALRSAELSRDAQALVTQLQQREQSLPATDVTTRSQLAAQITNLVPISNGHDPNFSQLQIATVPTAPTGTSLSLIVLLAALAGLVVGIAGALILEFANRRVRDEDEALSVYPLPVLGRVPQLRRGVAEATSAALMPPRVREVFRTLQLQLPSKPAGRGRSIMFASSSVGDGKTASAIDLALMLAAAGRDVILFDFDLRKPDIGNRLGIHGDVMDLFRAGGTLEEVLVESVASPHLRIVSTTPRADVAPLLEAVSRRMPALLDEAVQLADYVIIDTAPLAHVSDALRVATVVDDIVLVVRPGKTDRGELAQTRDLLERMGFTPAGMLLVGESAPAAASYGVYGADQSRAAASPAQAGDEWLDRAVADASDPRDPFAGEPRQAARR